MTGPALASAPFHADVALGPEGGRAWWVHTDDNVRIRFALWPLDGAKGTVLMFPGRTEYIEKYGQLAQDFQSAGYAMAALDWRGQGLSDRAKDPRDLGHVDDFAEYQLDVAAIMAALASMPEAPRPWYLLAHSMGGAIGLRAMHEGHDFDSVAFSAPMWGIAMGAVDRLTARLLRYLARPLGLEGRFVPSTGPAMRGEFDTNKLTTDRAQFDYMERQTEKYPELALGGPSVRWLTAALTETAALIAKPVPDQPALTLVGSNERIVAVPAIKLQIANWPGSRLEILEGAEHEVLMESPELRGQAIGHCLDWFAAG